MQSLRGSLWLCAIGTALIPLFAGCGGGGGGGSSGGGGGVVTPPPTLSLTVVTPKGLPAKLAEDKATVAVGGTVNYTLTLTNTTGTAVSINAPSATAPPAYLLVKDPSGTAVYNPLPPPPLTIVSLAPGQSLKQTVAVAVFGAAGKYTAIASFSFSDGTLPTSVGPLSVTAQ